MSTPLCSIIIPTYNHAEHIESSVRSSLAQTLQNKEVIVVDDGSTDDTSQRLRRFQGAVIYHRKESAGLGAARNQGISLSRGRYLQFLDADDSIAPNKLEQQIGFLLSHPNVDVVYSDCYVVDPAGVTGRNASRPLARPEDAVRELLKANLMPVHASVVKRSALIDIGMFDESKTAQEDWDLWLRLALRGFRFQYVAGDTGRYNQAGSLMTTDAVLMYRRTKHLLDKHRASADIRRLGAQAVRYFVAHQSLLLATRAYNNGWWKRSREHFWEAALADPKLMTLQYLACIPKAALHELVDRVTGRRVVAPD